MGEKERDHDLTSLRKEIATLVAEKCVDPSTQRPYAVGMIEKAMAEAGYSVKQNKNAKSQVTILCHPRTIISINHSIGIRMYKASTIKLQSAYTTCTDAY